MPTFNVTQDRILVKPEVRESNKTAGGILLPDQIKDEPMIGEVVSVGPGTIDKNGKRKTPRVVEGDRVLYGKWSGETLEIDKISYRVMYEKDIFGTVNTKS